MLSVPEALRLVLDHARPLPPVEVRLADALGLLLAADAVSDVDSPPHDKSIVDGYAVVAADLASGQATLAVLEEVTAGAVPARTVVSGTATRLMTGAPLPPGADAVAKIEETTWDQAGSGPLGCVTIRVPRLGARENVMARASSLRRGDVVVTAGTPLRPIEIGVLAEAGCAHVGAYARPRVAVLATGNELVPAESAPAAGQIRNSNGPMLLAAAAQAGATAIDLGIARDSVDDLRAAISRGLAHDVLLVSGGVSAGVLDLAPGVLASLGVRQVFHKVSLKPGKPLWFGVAERAGGQTLAFGLPGNPVSSLVCFELFVRPALAKLAGHGDAGRPPAQAVLASALVHRGERPTYHPARLRRERAGFAVEPLDWRGSADLRALVQANALAIFPAGDRHWQPGETVDVLEL